MKAQLKETKMLDGWTVFDVNLFANSNPKFGHMCIFTCNTEKDAQAFMDGLKRLMEEHTVEGLESI